MTDDTDYLTARQAAELLGRGVSTVHRYHELGRLPAALQLPGQTGSKLFARSDVEQLADELGTEQAAS